MFTRAKRKSAALPLLIEPNKRPSLSVFVRVCVCGVSMIE